MRRVELYLNLSKKVFEKTKEEANKEGISTSGKEGKDDLLYPYVILVPDKSEGMYFDEDKNTIIVAGEIFLSNETDELKDKMGYASLTIPIEMDLALEMIESYRNKLGKIKTILEATK